MKSVRLILALCILTLLAYSPLDAAPKPKHGVQAVPESAPSLDSLYSNSYAVIIGINAYEKWPSLEYAVNDAKAIEKRLKGMGFDTITLLDNNATRDRILKVLGDELPRKINKNDRVIIFFAGHGQTEELADGSEMGYIVPVDGDTRNIFSTAISMDQVRQFSRRLAAKHVLYLIDSCYSGLGLTRSGSIPPTERDYLNKITTRMAHQMLTAGGKGEQAHEVGGHGVFTKYLLDALAGAADRDDKGYITFSDLASYVKPRVSRETRNGQIPQYGSINGEGEFVFVTAKAATSVEEKQQTEEAGRLAEKRKKLDEEKQRLVVLQRPEASSVTETGRDGRFIAYSDGTVLDTWTRLMWAGRDNGRDITWAGAKSYCENYRGGGYTDWRIPTQDELALLYDTAKIYMTDCGRDTHLTELIRLTCTALWSTEMRGSTAAIFGFDPGKRYWSPQSRDNGTRVLPVRSVK